MWKNRYRWSCIEAPSSHIHIMAPGLHLASALLLHSVMALNLHPVMVLDLHLYCVHPVTTVYRPKVGADRRVSLTL